MIHICILTLFPEAFPGPLGVSVLKRARDEGIWDLHVVNIRDFAMRAYKSVDDACYGGGPGMIMRPDVVNSAIEKAVTLLNNPTFLYLSPRGFLLQQHHLRALAQNAIRQGEHRGSIGRTPCAAAHSEWIILCGRYEGIDERILQWWPFIQVSLGDFILCGGEIPAMALVEGYLRLIPGVLGNVQSWQEESFSPQDLTCPPDVQGHLLEHPLYTRPASWHGQEVPAVLLSGHHGRIAQWKQEQKEESTRYRRPDLWQRHKTFHVSSNDPESFPCC